MKYTMELLTKNQVGNVENEIQLKKGLFQK